MKIPKDRLLALSKIHRHFQKSINLNKKYKFETEWYQYSSEDFALKGSFFCLKKQKPKVCTICVNFESESPIVRSIYLLNSLKKSGFTRITHHFLNLKDLSLSKKSIDHSKKMIIREKLALL